uniref:Uncharacterized protein n=1 Tax=Arundo donax TaxID=35708 RepID=A0A0A9EK91_ARUDO
MFLHKVILSHIYVSSLSLCVFLQVSLSLSLSLILYFSLCFAQV